MRTWLSDARTLPEVELDRDKIIPAVREQIYNLIQSHNRKSNNRTSICPWPATFTGPAGTGKTRAALCLAQYAIAHPGPPENFRPGYGVAYLEFVELCQFIQAAKLGKYLPPTDRTPSSESDLWGVWQNFGLAIVDEIGLRGTLSDHQYEVLKRCIDAREGRPTVFISNLSLDELGRLTDDRIASRLAAGTVIEFDGADKRLEKYQH